MVPLLQWSLTCSIMHQVHVVSVPVALFAGLVVLPIYCFVLLLRSGIYLAPHSGVYTPIIFGTPPNQTPL
jgi:hypothetical protein